ncbi:hypothetical protein FA13DRAFT_1480557 [Coprinellus micaceus]|uniref:Uncharacterized protein n=1 Tax=Coprinellus micaceus TaxID=71717 RepID=A0A4Y7SL48_COPMI|nr:hypothetical protein FA13DRAFT_1480557 [Coprinellus micaceus]
MEVPTVPRLCPPLPHQLPSDCCFTNRAIASCPCGPFLNPTGRSPGKNPPPSCRQRYKDGAVERLTVTSRMSSTLPLLVSNDRGRDGSCVICSSPRWRGVAGLKSRVLMNHAGRQHPDQAPSLRL